MAWISENWFWVLTFVAFAAMHMFGHGGHGGHSGHGGKHAGGTDEAGGRPVDAGPGAHRH